MEWWRVLPAPGIPSPLHSGGSQVLFGFFWCGSAMPWFVGCFHIFFITSGYSPSEKMATLPQYRARASLPYLSFIPFSFFICFYFLFMFVYTLCVPVALLSLKAARYLYPNIAAWFRIQAKLLAVACWMNDGQEQVGCRKQNSLALLAQNGPIPQLQGPQRAQLLAEAKSV